MSSDPNALQNAEAQKQSVAGHEQDLRQRTEKIMEVLKGLEEDACKRVLTDALMALNSKLIVSIK